MKVSRDRSGNSILTVEAFDLVVPAARGFSVQTNGNLPEVHRRAMQGLPLDVDAARAEVTTFIKTHGSAIQRRKMGI